MTTSKRSGGDFLSSIYAFLKTFKFFFHKICLKTFIKFAQNNYGDTFIQITPLVIKPQQPFLFLLDKYSIESLKNESSIYFCFMEMDD
ncbi:hypothetical protein LEP1GSC193_2352 [Leptospira alstonii serovar Pingchang str. 80-412]|uniref:Uncharacterized protein n=2 Tax=Leptospira alstonii TaxID=28452 RepID=M6D260_9LEPT|nr:hypothetical protein LEP1GSC194_2389 [Leptospira alstonii serovar Sichuan str. 79601]EQA81154.1 hypothetical protein LEP1GSC193_2352 [Leptospira alstonii serovar Pingchang str. 80-412]